MNDKKRSINIYRLVIIIIIYGQYFVFIESINLCNYVSIVVDSAVDVSILISTVHGHTLWALGVLSTVEEYVKIAIAAEESNWKVIIFFWYHFYSRHTKEIPILFISRSKHFFLNKIRPRSRDKSYTIFRNFQNKSKIKLFLFWVFKKFVYLVFFSWSIKLDKKLIQNLNRTKNDLLRYYVGWN